MRAQTPSVHTHTHYTTQHGHPYAQHSRRQQSSGPETHACVCLHDTPIGRAHTCKQHTSHFTPLTSTQMRMSNFRPHSNLHKGARQVGCARKGTQERAGRAAVHINAGRLQGRSGVLDRNTVKQQRQAKCVRNTTRGPRTAVARCTFG